MHCVAPVLSLPRDLRVAFDVDVVTGGRWQDAVDLPNLGAELLDGAQFPNCAAYETWLIGERRRLSAATETLLQEATLTSISLGKPGRGGMHRAIAFAEQSGDSSLAASAYRHLAGSDVLRGIYARADRRLATAEAAVTVDRHAAVELAAIGGVSRLDQGDVDGAIAIFRRGLAADLHRAHPFLPIMLAHTGRAYLLGSDLGAARRCLQESLDLARSRAWAGVTAAPLALLGHLAVAERDLVGARGLLEQAFARACQIADPCWETWSAHGLGLHASAVGDDASALAHLVDAITRSRPQRGGHLWSHVWALTAGVRIARCSGDLRAEGWYDEAIVIAQRCGMRALTDQLVHLN